ncbi:MAG: DUF2179 domain-containing protein [Anaerolineae bacterium]|nr:DUF2179 domain-containing protein [Anaerolineae bacterium]
MTIPDWITQLLSSKEFFAWVILPIIIFFARISDVTIGTIRIILVSRGKRNIAPLLGFFEVLIWIVVIGQLVQNLESVTSYVGYAAGFAAGNFIGMYIEDKLAMGSVIVRVFMPEHGNELVTLLRSAGYGVTCFQGEGASGPVMMVFTIIKRKALKNVIYIIHSINPKAFFSVVAVSLKKSGVFPVPQAATLESALSRRKMK